jgi:NADPH2:quinone reductase
MAIQMAKAMGARVITTASSREKCDVCLKLGAEVVINYNEQDFVAVVKEVTDGCGADVILDMVGGDYIPRNISAAAIEGRIISIAFLRGPQVEMNLMPVMLKRLTLTGSTLRPQSVAAKTRIAAYLHEDFWPLLELGKIKPLMHPENIDLADAPVAHELMESNKLIGKLVLAVNPTLELENG